MKKTLLSVIVVLLMSTVHAYSAGVHEYPIGESEQAVFQVEPPIQAEDDVEVQETVEEPAVLLVAETREVEATDEEPQEQDLEDSSEPAEDTEVETIYGGNLNIGSQITSEELGVYMEFVPYWIRPFGEEQQHDFIFALRTFAGEDLLSVTPEFSLTLFNNLLFVGTAFPLGFDFSEEESADFVAMQNVWVDAGYAWRFASVGARADYEIEYTNIPEQSVAIGANAYWHFREKGHEFPYPWTITVGPDAQWVYSFNNDEDFARDQVFLGARAEFQQMAQGNEDYFPRAWSPMFAMTFMNKWEQQSFGVNSYEWVWDPSLVFEVGLNPLQGLDFNFTAQIPIGEGFEETHPYERDPVTFRIQATFGIY